MSTSLEYTSAASRRRTRGMVFALCWAVLFIIYLPAARAGRVGDFPGWLNFLTSQNFIDYVNRKGSGIPSMYQFTQVVTWAFYQFLGVRAWPWHVLYITMQAVNALLLYMFFGGIFRDARMRYSGTVALAGVLLFCCSPYISEVVVWEPSFHYLLGLMLMLAVMLCARQYLVRPKARYIWWGGILFLLSSYSLEVFYLTPLFTAALLLYYRYVLNTDKRTARGVLMGFTVVQAGVFALYLLLLRLLYHSGVAHVGSVAIQFSLLNASKGLKYLFHILLFGRFLSTATRASVYHFCESATGLLLFYGLLAILVAYIALRWGRLTAAAKAIALLGCMVLLSLGLILPLWFPDTGLVIYDRYSYVLDAFIFMLIAALAGHLGNRKILITFAAVYGLANLRYTHKANAYWQQSAAIVDHLLATFPNDTTRTVLLLNLPECLDGVQMIGTRDDGEFRIMYNMLMPVKLTNKVYDVEAFYMSSTKDGAHALVVDDSTVKVTLNQWGTWWLYYGYGATSYENEDYRLIMRDQGHWYDLVLKHPAAGYVLLYCVGDEWKKLDWSKKNIDQY